MLLERSKEYMCQEHFDYFSERLKSEKKRAEDTLTGYSKDIRDLRQADVSDDVDKSSRVEAEGRIIALESAVKKRLQQIMVALRELGKRSNGDYGYCEDCGVEIGLERLDSVPYTILCSDCNTITEQKGRHFVK